MKGLLYLSLSPSLSLSLSLSVFVSVSCVVFGKDVMMYVWSEGDGFMTQ